MRRLCRVSKSGHGRTALRCAQALLSACGLAFALATAANPYLDSAEQAAAWLSSQQLVDGSWGGPAADKALYTSDAVLLFKGLSLRDTTYYRAVTWIENHAAGNVDFQARRVRALVEHQADTQAALSWLVGVQDGGTLGAGGWGLNVPYHSAPLDTALVLQSFADIAGAPPC